MYKAVKASRLLPFRIFQFIAFRPEAASEDPEACDIASDGVLHEVVEARNSALRTNSCCKVQDTQDQELEGDATDHADCKSRTQHQSTVMFIFEAQR